MEAILEKISSIIGKPVISIFDGNLEGYIKNVYVDKNFKKIKWLCVFDNETEEEKLINTKSIYNLNFDAIMIKNSSQTYPMESIDIDCINPIGYKIYRSSGKETGKVTDFYYDEKFNVKSLFINNQTIYDSISILKVGKNLIIEKETDTEKLCNFGPKKISEIKPLSNQKVTYRVANQNFDKWLQLFDWAKSWSKYIC